MRGNKKTKKAVAKPTIKKKAVAKKTIKTKKKVVSARLGEARAKGTKKSESVYGSAMPIPEMGTRIMVKEEVDEIKPEVAGDLNFNDEEDQEDAVVEKNTEEILPVNSSDMTDKQKTIIMYVAVCSVMAIIVFFWVMSVKYSLGQSFSNENGDPEASASLDKIKSSLSEMKEKINTASDFAQTQFKEATNSVKDPEAQKSVNPDISDDFTNQLKEKLENLNTNTNNVNTNNQ